MAAKPWIIQPLVLPVGDKSYTVQPADYTVGLTLIAVQRGESTTVTDKTEDAELFSLVMGGTWEEMLADKQPFPVMFRAGMAALQYQTAMIGGLDNDAAVKLGETLWNTGELPEAIAAASAAKAPAKKASKRSTVTAGADKIAPPASGNGTTSRRTTPRAATKTTAKAVRPSAGSKSASSGR